MAGGQKGLGPRGVADGAPAGRPPGQLPDLIYPEYRFRRMDEIRPCLAADRLVLPKQLHRVTVFTTFRCNLACRYCNTVRRPRAPGSEAPPREWPAKDEEYDLGSFRRLLEMLEPDPDARTVRHVHFTGGEPTLVKDLPDMIGLATGRGIPCSMTTNGTSAPELYRELVERGLREVRISCDTHVPAQFDHIVRRRGAYDRVIATIRELARLRDEEGKPLHVIINMCVGHDNRAQMAGFVRESISLGPDDVKLLSISHDREDLGQFEERARVIAEIESDIERSPPDRFPLLRRKLETVFAADASGLRDFVSRRLMFHCYVPLSERTVDTRFYYPCPVYVREGGAPLGRLDEDDFAEQQRKTLEFVRGTSCVDDEVCVPYCINCCKKFNLYANAFLDGRMRGLGGEVQPITVYTEHDGEITNAVVGDMMRRIVEERRAFPREVPYRPFVVVKPNGMPHRDEIARRLSLEGVAVAERRPIPDWNDVALRLYSVPLTEERVYRGVLLARALPQVELTSAGELWFVKHGKDGKDGPTLAELDRAKKRARSALPPANCLIRHRDALVATSLSYLHSPSEENYWIEAGLLLG